MKSRLKYIYFSINKRGGKKNVDKRYNEFISVRNNF